MSQSSDSFFLNKGFANGSINATISSICNFASSASKFSDQLIIVKCGNDHIANLESMRSVCFDIAILRHFGVNVALVHGGGPYITAMLTKFGINEQIVDDHHILNHSSFEIAEMVLRGRVAPQIAKHLHEHNVKSINITGRDCDFLIADKLRRIKRDMGSKIERILDLGMVGEPVKLNASFITDLFAKKVIPIISPIGVGANGKNYIVNADTCAGFVAKHLCADRLILLCDSDGAVDENGECIQLLSLDEIKKVNFNSEHNANIRHKLDTAVDALENGCKSVLIANGNTEHIILKEILGEQIGTTVY